MKENKQRFFKMCLKCLELLDFRATKEWIDNSNPMVEYDRGVVWLECQNARISKICKGFGYGSGYLEVSFAETAGKWSEDYEFSNFGIKQLPEDDLDRCSVYIKLVEVKSKKVVACKLEVLEDYSNYIVWVRDCGFLSCNRRTGGSNRFNKKQSGWY